MDKTLIRGAILVTMDDRRPDYFAGDLLIRGTGSKKFAMSPGNWIRGSAGGLLMAAAWLSYPG